ncbi:MAG: type II secretion system F family protein [bacterium]
MAAPVSIGRAQATSVAAASAAAGTKAKKQKKKKVPGANKIRNKELPTFTRQLAAMLTSGMPVVHCLMTLEEQCENKAFKEIIIGVRSQIEGGAMLSEALTAYPEIFDELYVNMFRAGETGGMLAETAGRIAVYLEARNRLLRKVKSAMMYPVIVMCVALSIAAGMITFIVPVFARIFSDFGAKLPAPTQFLVNVSAVVRGNAVATIGIFVGLVIAFIRFKKTERGKFILDGLSLKMPVIGDLATKISMSRFASTFAQLTRSGVPILSALEIVAFSMGNKVLGKTILDSRAVVERGEPLSVALRKDKKFPLILVNMLVAGEKTGKVDDMLDRIAEIYNDEVEAMLSGLTSLIEPLLMVFLGVLIGGIVVCMFLPIFKMHEIIKF